MKNLNLDNMNAELVELRQAVKTIATELAYVLRHIADPEDIKCSDKARMLEIAERLEVLNDRISD